MITAESHLTNNVLLTSKLSLCFNTIAIYYTIIKKKTSNVLNKVTSKQHTNNGAWLASEQDRARIGKLRAIGTCVTHVNVSQ